MDLALGGDTNRVEFVFPGRACCRSLSLERSSGGKSDVIWSIEADDTGPRLPIPGVIGETPNGFRQTVELAPDALANLATSDAALTFTTDVGSTHPFRLSELSATNRVVEVGGSRSVTKFQEMADYVAFYKADHAKADRGNRRYAAFLIGLALVGIVAALVVQRRRRSRSYTAAEPGV
jgi:hypothetical protein